jgi:hypothetical protein
MGAEAYRAAAAVFRAVVEQCLKLNGYDKEDNLYKRIEAAADERILTVTLHTRSHRCRLLGNDALHDAKPPTEEEIKDVYGLVCMMIESFYSTRPEVENALKVKGRIS